MNSRTFIIAEAGANHNRSFDQAKSLIDAACNAGADAIKLQTYSSSTLYSKNTPSFANYSNISELIKSIEIPREWQKDLKSYCDDKNIEFMSTPFDELAVEQLTELGVKRLKIAGFESTDPRFVKMVASTKLPIIVSAGIGTNIDGINDIINWISEVNKNPDITVLHCNNAYPTPNTDINLNRIDQIAFTYPNIRVGLSDHTRGILAPALAVAKGATCIEKHFTLSRLLPGPDHPFALEPVELKQMVDDIRVAELMCQDTPNRITKSEEYFSKAMRSVVAKKAIKSGEKLTIENITTKRPLLDNTIPAKNFYDVLGSVVTCDIEEDHIITFEELVQSC